MQAETAATLLADLGPASLLTSDLRRARDTAGYLAGRTGSSLLVEPRLAEIDLGGWQGLTRREARERFAQEYAAWQAGEDVRRGGGETYAEVGARAAQALLEALAEVPAGGVAVAVTHGGTARAAIGTLLELDVRSWWRLAPLGNCRWSVLVENRRGWQLDEHNAGRPLPEEATGDDAR